MADPNTSISLAPIAQALAPYLIQGAVGVVTGLFGLLSALLYRYTHILIKSAYMAQITAAAANEAGKAVSDAVDNLATARVNVGSPWVADAAKAILESKGLQDAIKTTGASPELVKSLIVGKFGELQTRMTVAPVTPDEPGQVGAPAPAGAL